MRNLHKTILPLAALATLIGCSADSREAIDSDQSREVVTPDTGEQKGKLMIATDVDLGGAKLIAKRVSSGVNGTEIVLDPNVFTTVVAGKYCIFTWTDSVSTQGKCDVEVAPNSSTIQELGSIKLERMGATANDLVFGLDWPARPGMIGSLTGLDRPIPHAPGTFTYGAYADFGAATFTVAEGEVTRVNVGASTLPSARIYRAMSRTLPNAPVSAQALAVLGKDGKPIPNAVVHNMEKTLRVSSATEDKVVLAYNFKRPAESPKVTIALKTPATEVIMGRLDLPKLDIQKFDGTWVKVDGTFSISLEGNVIYKDVPLDHGVDLIPSSYLGDKPYTIEWSYLSPNDNSPTTKTLDKIVTSEM